MPEHPCRTAIGPEVLRPLPNTRSVCPLNGKVQCIDYCIHQIVAALNAGGVWTTCSCFKARPSRRGLKFMSLS